MEEMLNIVILQRGWVAIGKLSEANASVDHLKLENAKVIRRWGTSKGIGQLVDGPTKDTVLDEAGTMNFHRNQMIFSLETKASLWNK